MSSKERIFNNRNRKVFRSEISNGEVAFGVCFLALLVLIGLWFASKKHDFDPAERDIATETLAADTVQDTLYRTPLQPWVEPGSTAGGAAAPALGIFPPAVLDGGWNVSTRLEEFTPETLYEKIDGAADQYIQFGLKAMHYLAVGKGDADLGVELYDMGTFPNALGIFAAQRADERKVEKLEKVHFYDTGAGAIGIFDRFYVKIAGNSSSPAVQEKARQLLGALAQIPSDKEAAAEPFLVLSDGLGVPFDGITYERADVFQFDFAKDFWFGRADDSGEARYYLHLAANTDDARALFDKLLENQLYDYDVVERQGDDVVLKHKYLSTFTTLNLLDRFVYGVDGAADQAGLDTALHGLQGALGHEAAAQSAS